MIVNLETTDLGLPLKSPMVASASPGWRSPGSSAQMRGLARHFSAADPAAFERASDIRAVLALDPARMPPPAFLRGT